LGELTLQKLVVEINRLPRDITFQSVGKKSQYRLHDVVLPNGPIFVERNNKIARISTNQLATIALACSNRPNYPLHVDRLFSAGGNTRSALETIIANTANFFVCKVQRIDNYTGEIKSEQRHFMYCPDEIHPIGEIHYKEYDSIISEVEVGVEFGEISFSNTTLADEFNNIEIKRTHTQIQIALIEIGNALNFNTWIAKNDQSIEYNNSPLKNHDGVIQTLDHVEILFNNNIKQAAEYVDCIWFTKDGKHIPAVIEIEHSTGVTSGMTRMSKLHSEMPSMRTQYVIVAPNVLRNKVVTEANQNIFSSISVGYMPYSTIRELYGLIQKYHIQGINHKFIESFIEPIIVEL